MELNFASWDNAKQRLCQYSRRQPETSSLYRIVYNYREEFELRWEELFQQDYGYLRPEVLKSFDAYLNCGILRHGCALACCESCSQYELIAFSCKKRVICPSCDAKRAHVFAQGLQDKTLLPFIHKHVVFTIPKRLRRYFLFDRELISELYQASWHAYNDFLTSILPGKTAAVIALHSAGSFLEWHPHLHGIFLWGSIADEGKFHPLDEIDSELIAEYFAENVFNLLLKKGLITEETIASMKSWEHSGFSVWFGEDILAENTEQRLFIARYLTKCPISLDRIELIDNPLSPSVRLYKNNERIEYVELSPLEFLAKLSLHIPPSSKRTHRRFGKYSYRLQGETNEEAQPKAEEECDLEQLKEEREEAKSPSRYWATCMKQVFEIDPLLCKECGGQMQIKSFIHSSSEIKKLCKKKGLADWRAPPPIGQSEVAYLDTSPEYVQ